MGLFKKIFENAKQDGSLLSQPRLQVKIFQGNEEVRITGTVDDVVLTDSEIIESLKSCESVYVSSSNPENKTLQGFKTKGEFIAHVYETHIQVQKGTEKSPQ